MTGIIPIFFTIDDAYAPYLAVALRSAIDNSSPDRRYRAIIVHQGLSDENATRLSAFAKENFEVSFVPMRSGLEFLSDNMSNRLRCDYFTLTIYFRLFIASMFPEYDKAVYVDGDTVVLGDIAELYDVDISDGLFAACNDASVMHVPQLVNYIERGVGVKGEAYVNSGVLLMNLSKLRELDFDSHVLSLLSEHHPETLAPDQDYLNAVCRGRIKYLPLIWNTMPNALDTTADGAKIIHYNLYKKPWHYRDAPLGEYFWEYARKTPYFDVLSAECAGYSALDREKDEKCTALLVERGITVPEERTTFVKLEERGVKIRI